jgi:ElaB/YqjD/DUF883 family membrane-anchored ribosome-binding protein
MLTAYESFNKDKLIKEFKAAIADAEVFLKETANIGDEKVAEIRNKTGKSIEIAKARMVNAQEAVLTRAKEARKATDTYVHENPWRSVSLAACIGVVIGILIYRR